MKENIFFILTHPIQSLRTKTRQIEVAIEHSMPPQGSTIEEFPELPIEEAARLLTEAEKSNRINLSDWPVSVQNEMKRGTEIHPDGRHPEHQNV